jgi:hypothetical protein
VLHLMQPQVQPGSLAGQEHGRTIPLAAEVAARHHTVADMFYNESARAGESRAPQACHGQRIGVLT